MPKKFLNNYQAIFEKVKKPSFWTLQIFEMTLPESKKITRIFNMRVNFLTFVAENETKSGPFRFKVIAQIIFKQL